MAEPGSARLAAEAFTNITGIDLQQNQLVDENAEDLQPQADDDAGEDAAPDLSLDEDENLPWPDVSRVQAIWANHGQNFTAGQRYFLGRPIDEEMLRNKLQTGLQRQRHAAALELALLDPALPYVNTRARVASV